MPLPPSVEAIRLRSDVIEGLERFTCSWNRPDGTGSFGSDPPRGEQECGAACIGMLGCPRDAASAIEPVPPMGPHAAARRTASRVLGYPYRPAHRS